MEEKKEVGFITACREFFGMKSGQKLTDFRDEIAALSPEDRAELTEMLNGAGFCIKA